jgi:hypothetical protein
VLEGSGVSLVSVTESLDTSTAMGEAVIALTASMAKQSSDDTSQGSGGRRTYALHGARLRNIAMIALLLAGGLIDLWLQPGLDSGNLRHLVAFVSVAIFGFVISYRIARFRVEVECSTLTLFVFNGWRSQRIAIRDIDRIEIGMSTVKTGRRSPYLRIYLKGGKTVTPYAFMGSWLVRRRDGRALQAVLQEMSDNNPCMRELLLPTLDPLFFCEADSRESDSP